MRASSCALCARRTIKVEKEAEAEDAGRWQKKHKEQKAINKKHPLAYIKERDMMDLHHSRQQHESTYRHDAGTTQ